MEDAPQNWFKETIRDRLLGSTQTDDDAFVVYIDNAQLKKNELERLERQLHALWRSDFPQYDLEIIFRSRAVPVRGKNPLINPLGVEVRKKAIQGVHRIIAVSSGKGGVGKSTLAANLAVGLAQDGLAVGLLDGDLYGPSAPTMLGDDSRLQVNENHKLLPRQVHGVKMVSFGNLSSAHTPVIWRGPLITKAFEQLCYDTHWGDLDYLVLDLPPGTGDIQLTMVEKLPIAAAIIISTPQDIALIDVAKGVSMFQKLDVPIIGIVENMSTYTCSNCGHEEHLFGNQLAAYADAQRLPVLAQIPLSTELRQRSDSGRPLGNALPAFAQVVDAVKRMS